MRSPAVAAAFVLIFLFNSVPVVLAQSQEPDKKPPEQRFKMFIIGGICSVSGQSHTFSCSGQKGERVELRVFDKNSPTSMTVVKAQNIQYDPSTGEIRPEGNVSVSLENANEQNSSRRNSN